MKSTKFVEKDFTLKIMYYHNKDIRDDFCTWEAYSNTDTKNKAAGRIYLYIFDTFNAQRIKLEVKRALAFCGYEKNNFEIYLLNKHFNKVFENVKNFLEIETLKTIGL